MAASQAMIGYGTLVSLESTTSPGDCPINYVALAEIKNVTPPNQQTDEVDVTHNTSPQRRREFIAGLIDPGEASFEMNFVPGSASDLRLQGLLTSGSNVNTRVTYPNLINWDFLALVKGYEIKSATADAMTATVTLKVTGSVTAN
jgi:predicted secreted protein